MRIEKTMVLAVALGAALTTWVAATMRGSDQHEMPPLPADAAAAPVELIEAWPFTLEQKATHWWRKEQPRYDAGYLLVLAVDKDAVHPRQTYEPVLYVGDETAERVNLGHESGFVVAIVPSERDASGAPALDLASAPIFFGSPALPEEIDREAARAERKRALELGVTPPSPDVVKAAMKHAVSFDDDFDLHYFAADRIEQYSPMERDLIAGLRVPRVGD